MPQESCPYCEKVVELSYGKGVACPQCGGRVDVSDEKHPLPQKVNIFDGYDIGSLSDHTSRKGEFHEGHAGRIVSDTGITYKNIGGLDEVIYELDLLVNGSMKYPEIWRKLGRKKTRAVLLSGPPGCGKTLLAQALASETKRKVSIIQGSEIKGWRQGASEGNLVAAYESVRPSGILIIDEIDAIGGKREQMVNETNASIVGTLCSIFDGAKYKDDVVIVATTNKPHMLDEALRRPGRLDLEINILPPNIAGREQIFKIHTSGMPLAKDIDLEILAKRAHGFTGADIGGVCAALSRGLLKRAVRQLKQNLKQEEIIKSLFIDQEEFIKVISETVPSLLRENYVEVSKVHWEDVGGLDKVKKELQRIVVWPLKYGDLMEKMRLRQPKGLLLYGPPGCGKTLLAKAISTESEYNFLVVNGPALLSKWVGSTEEAIRDIFLKARQAQPCIIFLDELESIAPIRGRSGDSTVMDRAVSQLLAEIDGVQTLFNVFIIAATNRADLVDSALLRPGRLDLQFEVPPPDARARKEILEIHLEGTPLQNIDLEPLIELTAGQTGAMIEAVCTTAKKNALERHILLTNVGKKTKKQMAVIQEDLLNAIKEINQRKY